MPIIPNPSRRRPMAMPISSPYNQDQAVARSFGRPSMAPSAPSLGSPASMSLPDQQQAYNAQPSRAKATQSSPMFLNSVTRNNQVAGAGKERDAALRAVGPARPVSPASMSPTPMGPGGMPSRNIGYPGSMLPGAVSATDGSPLVSSDPNKARATITLGSPVAPQITPQQHAGNEMQRERNVAAQQGRGLGLQPKDGGAYQYAPMPITAPPEAPKQTVVDYNRPAPTEYSPEQQAQRQQIAQQYQHRVSDINSGGQLTQQGLAQQGAETAATTAQAQATAANARVLEAQRPRQATPGTQAKEPSVSELAAAMEQAEIDQKPEIAAQLREKMYARLGVGPKPAAATQPSEVPNQAQMIQQSQAAPSQASPTTQPAAPQVEDHEDPTTGKRYRLQGNQWVAVN